MRSWKVIPLLILSSIALTSPTITTADDPPISGGLADGPFCTYGKRCFSNSTEAALRIQDGFPFSIGVSHNTYTFRTKGLARKCSRP